MEIANRRQNLNIESSAPEVALVESMDRRDSEDRSWFREFLSSIFSSPDLDYSQFMQLESKKTRHQIDLRRWY